MSWDCFISYASADVKHAEVVFEHLHAAGLTIWFDKFRLNPGCQWHQEIEAGCEGSRLILPILTPLWKQSAWTRFETYGHEEIIPLWFEGTMDDVFTPPLRRFQAHAVNLSRPDEHDWARLVDAIRTGLAKPMLEKTARLVHICYGHTPHFVGREEKLNEIHEKLWTNPTAALTQGRVEAVTALGGVGKTTLAREYAERFWRLYPQVFWVDCRRDLNGEFAAIYDLVVPTPESELTLAQKAKKAIVELNQSNDRPRRLLILDDAPDQDAVAQWIPHAGHCHTLITSRFTAWTGAVETCPVWVLEPEAARLLLLRRSGRRWEAMPGVERGSVDALAEKLGFLPLALEQAAAFIAKQPGYQFTRYLAELAEDETTVLDRRTPGSTEYPDSVYSTWRKTIEKLPAGARAMLRLSAMLAPTSIPFEFFGKSPEVLADCIARIAPPATGGASPPSRAKIRDCWTALMDYSMALPEVEDAFSVHALVQAVEVNHTPEAEKIQWVFAAKEMFLRVAPNPRRMPGTEDFPFMSIGEPTCPTGRDGVGAKPTKQAVDAFIAEKHRRVSTWKLLYPHGLRIAGLLPPSGEPSICRFLELLADALRADGQYGPARQLYLQAAACYELGRGHLDATVARCVRKHTISALAFADASVGACIRAYDWGVNYEMEVHILSAAMMHQTGMQYLRQGRTDEAPVYLELAVVKADAACGQIHPQTLAYLGDLAYYCAQTKHFAAAEPLDRWVLAARIEMLGAAHPHTLLEMKNLAYVLKHIGKLAEAEQLYRECATLSAKSLGDGNALTVQTLVSLATLLVDNERYAEAEDLYSRACKAWKPQGSTDDLQIGTSLAWIQVLRQQGRSGPDIRKKLEDAGLEAVVTLIDSLGGVEKFLLALADESGGSQEIHGASSGPSKQED